METTTKPVHIGRKITRIRELRGIKQEQIAMELGVSEGVINFFNTFNDASVNNGNGILHANNCTFNPIDKLIEVFEENKTLYERLLKSEQEKVALLKGKA